METLPFLKLSLISQRQDPFGAVDIVRNLCAGHKCSVFLGKTIMNNFELSHSIAGFEVQLSLEHLRRFAGVE